MRSRLRERTVEDRELWGVWVKRAGDRKRLMRKEEESLRV